MLVTIADLVTHTASAAPTQSPPSQLGGFFALIKYLFGQADAPPALACASAREPISSPPPSRAPAVRRRNARASCRRCRGYREAVQASSVATPRCRQSLSRAARHRPARRVSAPFPNAML